MKRTRTAFLPVVLLFVSALAFAQKAPSTILEYFDNSQQITITNKDGMQYQLVNFGMALEPGDQIATRNSSAELRLDPNGTIIKLAPYSDFTVDSLQASDRSGVNAFTLNSGSLRAVAARFAGANYEFRTHSAVGGVRGTDFGMQVIPGKTDALFVKEGAVQFSKIGGPSLMVTAGHFADALAPTFQAVALSAQQVASLFKNLDFSKLKVAQVPGHQEVAQSTSNEPAPPPPSQPSETQGTESSSGSGAGSGVMAFLNEFLGLQIGGVSINGTTYSRVVAQPHFQIGKLKAALYLPIIYSSNLFDANSWYKPGGNNEWSFGSDQPTLITGAEDFLTDLVLKIRYVEWGKQRDPFFFKVGNLNDMTLGHGILMRNFANDSDFPSVRRVGLNLGIDFKTVGFETVVNNLANPQIMGGRFYVRPLGSSFPLALGLSAATDLAPASELPDTSTMPAGTQASVISDIQNTQTANPLFLNLAVDLDLPIVESDPFSIILFGDVAGLVPYLRNPVTVGATTLAQGFHTDALLYTDPSGKRSLRNYGIESGVFGNALGLTYRLEYRNFNGIFRPTMYDSTYERMRGQYAQDVINYLADPNAAQYQRTTMGIYGEAGFTLLKAVNFEAGYFWPWTWGSNGQIEFAPDDYLKLQLSVNKKILPFGFYGSISYVRSKFIPTLLNDPAKYGTLSLFDANTVVSGELVYPVAPSLSLILQVTTTVRHDSLGNLVLDSSGNPVMAPSVSIETQVGF